MFSNVGGKIKTFAAVVCVLGIVVFAILGAIPIVSGIESGKTESIIYGILIILVGCVISWVSVFILYAFGQLVENSDKIVKILDKEGKATGGNEQTGKTAEENGQTGKRYFNPKWEEDIKKLTDEELQERINSKEWQASYRELCERELESRQ